MKIGNLLYKTNKTICDNIGLYSKKQCVKISTQLGKDLVDFKNSSGEITEKVLYDFLHKHVPKAKIEIITSPDKFDEKILGLGFRPEILDKLKQNMTAMYFNLYGGKGIYIPELERKNTPAVFAHEVEHFMYNEHYLPTKLMIKFRDFILSKSEYSAKDIDLKSFNEQGHAKKKGLEFTLREYFGINKIARNNGYENTESSTKGFFEFLKGEHFDGLTSERRVKAYIRRIIRGTVHPTEKRSFIKLHSIKRSIADETRAYKVTDNVIKYMNKTSEMNAFGFRSDIYKITTKLLKREKRLAIINFLKKAPAKKTGLPTIAYVENSVK